MMFLDEIKCLLEEDHSRKQTNTIVNFVGDDKKKMKALMSFFLDNKWEWRFNQWAAWPVGYIGRKYPKLIIPYFEDLIRVMDNPSHNAVLRNTIRILEDIEVPEKYEGEIYQRCFVFLNDPDQPTFEQAVNGLDAEQQIHAMQPEVAALMDRRAWHTTP